VVLAVIRDFYLPQVCFTHTFPLYTIYLKMQEKTFVWVCLFLGENEKSPRERKSRPKLSTFSCFSLDLLFFWWYNSFKL